MKPRARRARQGFVYFFQAASGLIKIGRTADPATRLRSLTSPKQRGSVIGVMLSSDAPTEETAIHRACSEHRFKGEWFHPEVLPKIDGYRSRFLAVVPSEARHLVQSWVSPQLYEALVARAEQEGVKLVTFVRRELGKIIGVIE